MIDGVFCVWSIYVIIIVAYSGKTTTIYIEGDDYVPDDCKKYLEDFSNCQKWRDDVSFKALVSNV